MDEKEQEEVFIPDEHTDTETLREENLLLTEENKKLLSRCNELNEQIAQVNQMLEKAETAKNELVSELDNVRQAKSKLPIFSAEERTDADVFSAVKDAFRRKK